MLFAPKNIPWTKKQWNLTLLFSRHSVYFTIIPQFCFYFAFFTFLIERCFSPISHARTTSSHFTEILETRLYSLSAIKVIIRENEETVFFSPAASETLTAIYQSLGCGGRWFVSEVCDGIINLKGLLGAGADNVNDKLNPMAWTSNSNSEVGTLQMHKNKTPTCFRADMWRSWLISW